MLFRAWLIPLATVAVLLFGCASQRPALREPVLSEASGVPHIPPDYLSSGKDRLILVLNLPNVKAACISAGDPRAMMGELVVQVSMRDSAFGNVRVMFNTMRPRLDASDETIQAFQVCAHQLAVALFSGWNVPVRMDVLSGQATVRFEFSPERIVLIVSTFDLATERHSGPPHLRSHERLSVGSFVFKYHEPRERLLDFIDSFR